MATRETTGSAAKPTASASAALRQKLLENEQVLVVETSYPVGSSVPTHTHRYPHVIYVINGGTVQTTAPDGTVGTVELGPRETLWAEAGAHATLNIGATPVRIVEIEIKTPGAAVKREKVPHWATPADFVWSVDSLDPRRKSALLLGDPSQPGPYTIRSLCDAGYILGLHEHPAEDEHLTVLSGSLHWSTGKPDSDAPEHVAPAGSFVLFPAGTPHRVWTTEATEIQMNGVGPREYHYFDAGDDPRKAMNVAPSVADD